MDIWKPANRPFLRDTIDSGSGLHELWMMRLGRDGLIEILAGPVPWPKGWVEIYNKAIAETQD